MFLYVEYVAQKSIESYSTNKVLRHINHIVLFY